MLAGLNIYSDFAIEVACRRQRKTDNETHFHDAYEIYYLEKGSITYFVDGNIYNVCRGDFVLIKPGLIHITKFDEREHKRILIYFKEKYLEEFIRIEPSLLDIFDNVHIRLLRHENERAKDILRHLCVECGKENGSEVLKKCLAGELLCLIGKSGAEPPVSDENSENSKILSVTSYINENYEKPLTLESLSKTFYQNSTYFSRNFKKMFGTGFKEYLTSVRMKAAVKLLKDSNLNVTQIAYRVGFNSQNHFCKIFKSTFGMSPLQYRKFS